MAHIIQWTSSLITRVKLYCASHKRIAWDLACLPLLCSESFCISTSSRFASQESHLCRGSDLHAVEFQCKYQMKYYFHMRRLIRGTLLSGNTVLQPEKPAWKQFGNILKWQYLLNGYQTDVLAFLGLQRKDYHGIVLYNSCKIVSCQLIIGGTVKHIDSKTHRNLSFSSAGQIILDWRV